MGYFVGELDARDLHEEGTDRARMTLGHFGYVRTNGDAIYVEPGFIYDGASIPRRLWGIVGSPFTGDYRRAAVIHDKLCAEGRAGTCRYDSPEVHKVFYEAMRDDGVGRIRAAVMWAAVRVAGPHFKAGV